MARVSRASLGIGGRAGLATRMTLIKTQTNTQTQKQYEAQLFFRGGGQTQTAMCVINNLKSTRVNWPKQMMITKVSLQRKTLSLEYDHLSIELDELKRTLTF